MRRRRPASKEAGYVLLRLPLEVRDLFREWLMANFPDRYRHVFKLIRDMRGGKDYDSELGQAHDRHRARCLDDRPALRGRLREARPQPGAARAHHRAFRAAAAARRSSSACSERVSIAHARLRASTVVTLGVRDLPAACASMRRSASSGSAARPATRSRSSTPAAWCWRCCAGTCWRRMRRCRRAAAAGFRGMTLAWNCRTEPRSMP